MVGTRGSFKSGGAGRSSRKGREPLSLVSGFQAGEQFEEITALPLEGKDQGLFKNSGGMYKLLHLLHCSSYPGTDAQQAPGEGVLKAARDIVAAGL